MNYRERVGQNIKYYRKESGLTLKDVANRLGVTEAAVQKYEAGAIKQLDIEKLERIAEAIGATVGQLTGWISEDEKKAAHEARISHRVEKHKASYENLPFEQQKQVDKYIKMISTRSNGKPYIVSDTEVDLLEQYRQLNEEGKERLFENLDDMLRSGKYLQKSDSSGLVEESA